LTALLNNDQTLPVTNNTTWTTSWYQTERAVLALRAGYGS